MTDALDSTVPAGWYPDPWGSASQRWWDGAAWTEKLKSEADPPAEAEEEYTPVAVRSTFEPAVTSSGAASPGDVVSSTVVVAEASPLPSRRALRELAAAPASETPAEPATGQPVAGQAAASASALPPLTQTPEFSPEPVSALPPPVWSDPVIEPVEPVAPAPAEPDPAPAAAPASPLPAAAQPVPAFTSTTAPDDEWAASLTRWDDSEPRSTPTDSVPIFGDAPPVSYTHRAARYRPLHGRTSAVWLLVFIPLLQAVAIVGSMYVFPGLLRFDTELSMFVPAGDPATLVASAGDWLLFALAPLSIAFFVFTLVLGFQDRARLRLLSHDRTASPWWIVLSLFVYLIIRSVRVRQSTGRRGSGPLTTFVCLYIAPPLSIFIALTVASSLQGAIPV